MGTGVSAPPLVAVVEDTTGLSNIEEIAATPGITSTDSRFGQLWVARAVSGVAQPVSVTLGSPFYAVMLSDTSAGAADTLKSPAGQVITLGGELILLDGRADGCAIISRIWQRILIWRTTGQLRRRKPCFSNSISRPTKRGKSFKPTWRRLTESAARGQLVDETDKLRQNFYFPLVFVSLASATRDRGRAVLGAVRCTVRVP